jgi:hypothetical protein
MKNNENNNEKTMKKMKNVDLKKKTITMNNNERHEKTMINNAKQGKQQ